MMDTDFEAVGRLLTNAGYFDRVRELCREGLNSKQAWEQVERELPFGLRRFTHYVSFRHARESLAKNNCPLPLFKVI